MSGTKEGGALASETNRKRYGKNFYNIIATKGGSWRGRKGFAAMDRDQVAEYGRKGGERSSRAKRLNESS